MDALQELLYGLYALISVHFRKEEDIQLPAFDAAPPERTEAVLERAWSPLPGTPTNTPTERASAHAAACPCADRVASRIDEPARLG